MRYHGTSNRLVVSVLLSLSPSSPLSPLCCTTCMLASDTHGSCVSTRRGMCRHAQPSFPISCPGLGTDRQAAMASPPPLSPPWKGEMNIGAPCQHQVFECCNKIMRTYRQPSTTTWRLANPLQAVPSLESTKRWHSRVIYLFFKGKCWMDHLYFIFPLHSKNFSFSFFPPSLHPHFSNTSPFPYPPRTDAATVHSSPSPHSATTVENLLWEDGGDLTTASSSDALSAPPRKSSTKGTLWIALLHHQLRQQQLLLNSRDMGFSFLLLKGWWWGGGG